MPIPVHDGTTTVFCGDSLTAQGWFWSAQSQVGGTDLLVDQLSPLTVAPRGAYIAPGSQIGTPTGRAATVAPVAIGGQINAINSGHGGEKIGDCLANISSWILAFSPQVLVLQFGENDCNPPFPPFTPTTLVAFRASYDAVLDQTLAAFPSCAIACISIFMNFEQWVISGGVPAWDNTLDPPPGSLYTPSILEFNQQIQQSCVAHGGTYIDTRTASLAYEAANNIPAPGVLFGPLTIDGKHPNATGQLLMSDQALPAFVFS